jgi:putative ABC transport system permease protein
MWRHYLRLALARLAAERLYSAVSILGLTVGFSVAILVGLYARHELSYDRWLPDHQRLYLAVQTLIPPANGAPWRSYATRTDVAKSLRTDVAGIDAVARLAPAGVVITRGDVATAEPDFGWADPNFFDLLKFKVLAGDPRTALEAPDGLVLTRSLARKYFGGDAPLGESLTVQTLQGGAGSRPETLGPAIQMQVRAVIEDPPPDTNLKVSAFGSALAPPIHAADQQPAGVFGQVAFTYVRLSPGASAAAVQARLPAFVAHRIASIPLQGNRLALTLTPLAALHLPAQRINNPGAVNPPADPRVLQAMVAIAGLVLLTAIVNFVGLATARGARRAVEVGVRKAVGASRRDLIFQFMTETVLQALIALVLAVAVAELAAPYVGAFVQRILRLDYTDPLLMVAIPGLGLLAGVVAGAYPAFLLSAFRPVTALKGGPQAAGGSAGVRQGLVIVQFAVLILLMLVIATLYRQTGAALDQARRFGGDHVLWIGENGLCGGAFEARVRSLPGVRAVSCSANTAISNRGADSSAVTRDGRLVPVTLGPMDVDFFPFYGIRPIAGRLFSPDRGEDVMLMQPGAAGWPSVILNASAVRRLGFASPQAAVGQVIRWGRLDWRPGSPAGPLPPGPSPVVGVVPDYVMGASREPTQPMIYWIDPAFFGTVSVKLDGAATPEVLAGLDRIWRDTGHIRPMRRRFLDQAVRQAYADVLILSTVIAVCAGIALVIACIGLFALAAFTAEQRTKEIGVRKALGAGTTDLVRLLLWQFTKPVLVACLIASPLAWLVMRRWLEGFPERVGQPPWLFAASAAAAVLIAWLTVGAHTLIMARARPVSALRYE